MAYQYAKLGLAALLAAPALAIPMPQVTEVVTVVNVVTIGPDGQPAVGAAQPTPNPAPAVNPPAAAPTSSSSSDDVQAEAVKTSAKPSSQPAATSAAAPKVTSSATPASSAGSSSGGSSGGKKGLAYTKDTAALAMATQIASSSGGAITWMYDWEGYPFVNGQGSSSYEVAGAEFVPMLHSPDSMFTSAWSGANPGPQGKSAKHALFINEPDYTSVDAGSAASLYKNTYMPGAPSAQLGGPATTGGTGLPWLKQFIPACKNLGCKIDFMPYHYYSGSTDLSEMQAAVKAIHDYVQMPIWITEFGLTAQRDGGSFSEDQRATFIAQASQWMDGTDYIERYAPYQVSDTDSSDSMQPGNTLATKYVSA